MVLRRLTAQIQTQTDSNTAMNVSYFNEELSFTLIQDISENAIQLNWVTPRKQNWA